MSNVPCCSALCQESAWNGATEKEKTEISRGSFEAKDLATMHRLFQGAPVIRDLVSTSRRNEDYRKVVFTTPEMQLVLMNLIPGEKIPLEVHRGITQTILVVSGNVKAEASGKRTELAANDVIIIPPNTPHKFWNSSTTEASLFSVYSPPVHPENLVQEREPQDTER